VQHDSCVLSCLDDLIEVTQCAFPYRSRKWSIDPFRFAAAKQKPADQVGGRETVLARDGYQWPTEVVSHCLNEARRPASGRTLQ
jgi:hypothetical protein